MSADHKKDRPTIAEYFWFVYEYYGTYCKHLDEFLNCISNPHPNFIQGEAAM